MYPPQYFKLLAKNCFTEQKLLTFNMEHVFADRVYNAGLVGGHRTSIEPLMDLMAKVGVRAAMTIALLVWQKHLHMTDDMWMLLCQVR